MGVGSGLYMYDVIVKRSRPLSHLPMSSCKFLVPSKIPLERLKLETSSLNLVCMLIVANPSLRTTNHPWMGRTGVVRSREPFKFCWAPTISLERLIVSGAVCRRDLYSAATGRVERMIWLPYAARRSRRNCLIIMWCDTEYLACAEPLRRAGLSAIAEFLVSLR